MVHPRQLGPRPGDAVGRHQLELGRTGRHCHHRLQQRLVGLRLHDHVGDSLQLQLLAAPERLEEDVHVVEGGPGHALQLGGLEGNMALGAAAVVQGHARLGAAPGGEGGEEGGAGRIQQ